MKRPGFLYILRAENGLYKIGHTRNIQKRISQFQHLPVKVELVHVIACEDVIGEERSMHKSNAEYRVSGEWFRLPDWYVDSLKIIDVMPATDNEDYWVSNACAFEAARDNLKDRQYWSNEMDRMDAEILELVLHNSTARKRQNDTQNHP